MIFPASIQLIREQSTEILFDSFKLVKTGNDLEIHYPRDG